MPTEAPTVYNHDISGIFRRINRFVVEARDCASNAQSRISDADLARLKTYHGSILSYVDWVAKQPQLDMPEGSLRLIALDANPVVPVIENDDLLDLITLYAACRDEAVNSQSARMPSGLLAFDRARLENIVRKADDFLTSYVAKVSPLDLPESSPMREISGPGRIGV